MSETKPTYSCRITVMTPTYNRAGMIGELYGSLKRQTFRNFEWLVVDDGSTDQTQEIFERWQKEEVSFPIRYVFKENGGKHSAVNMGLDLARGELFMVVDSDDYLTDDALEKIDRWFDTIAGKPEITGVAANKGYSKEETVNPLFHESYLDKTLLEMNTYEEEGKKVISGERALCFYTDFHRRYKYPQFENERFVTEAVVYNRMAADGYRMRFYNDIIWIYEYKDDGLTKAGSRLFLQNPRGYGLWLREKAEFEHDGLVQRLRMIYTFTCDLSPLHDVRTIAEGIGAPMLLVAAMKAAHDLKNRLRKRG